MSISPLDDWVWMWLPSYTTIINIHDEELRRRTTPFIYDEYVLGLSRYLAAKADAGEITPDQLVTTFNVVLKWLFTQMAQHEIMLVRNFEQAREADRDTLTLLAVGLATATAASMNTGSTYQQYRTVNCQVVPGMRNSVTGQSYGASVICR